MAASTVLGLTRGEMEFEIACYRIRPYVFGAGLFVHVPESRSSGAIRSDGAAARLFQPVWNRVMILSSTIDRIETGGTPTLSASNESTVGLYEKGGVVFESMILLTPESARCLCDALRLALESPEAAAQSAWPGTLCSFSVSPQFRGKEQYLSFHLDAGPKPLSPTGVRWRRARDTVTFLLTGLGFVCLVRWLLSTLGVWHA